MGRLGGAGKGPVDLARDGADSGPNGDWGGGSTLLTWVRGVNGRTGFIGGVWPMGYG